MKLRLVNTINGLVPYDDDDFEEKRKLELGEVYEAEIKVCRNLQFHRKARALLNCAWHYLPESKQKGFRTIENFRKYLTVAAGYCEVFFSPKLGQFVEYPKSWAFDKMDNAEFEGLYNGVRGVIDSLLATIVSKEEFDNYLKRF